MYNKIYIVETQHFDYFTGTKTQQIVAKNIKEVEEIKRTSTYFIDNDSYQKITAIIPVWVFERPTHQSGCRPAVDDLLWSSNISNESFNDGLVRDIIPEDININEDVYVFDKGDVVF